MSLILSLESSTSVCSIAIHDEGKLIGYKFIPDFRAASSRLLPDAKELLKEKSIEPRNLSAVAVSAGPGSYTGLRISVSAAKGICYALEVPLISVGSLQVLTAGVVDKIKCNFYCSMIDARRMEVYTSIFDGGLNEIEPVTAEVIDEGFVTSYLERGQVVFFGDGSVKFKSIANHPNTFFVDGEHPRAEFLGELAFKKFERGDFENLEQFEPQYLKDFLVKKPKPKVI